MYICIADRKYFCRRWFRVVFFWRKGKPSFAKQWMLLQQLSLSRGKILIFRRKPQHHVKATEKASVAQILNHPQNGGQNIGVRGLVIR
jgi:hypothetical protein